MDLLRACAYLGVLALAAVAVFAPRLQRSDDGIALAETPGGPWPVVDALDQVELPGDVREAVIHDVSPAEGGALKVVLRAKDAKAGDPELLTIYIGGSEAMAIARAINGIEPPRPMTHELLSGMAKSLGVTVEKVTVTKLQNDTFYAAISMKTSDGLVHLDARPSDSLALAAMNNARIYIAKDVLEQVGTPEVEAELEEQDVDPKKYI